MIEWTAQGLRTLLLDGVRIEYATWGPPPSAAPTIVLLHEGLGCVALWRDFPDKLSRATGMGVCAYSRQGYGGSDACELPRPVDYMQREAVAVVPKLLDAIGFERGVLFGHSDGGSIAAYYVGTHQDHRVRGLILMAPHFFAEPDGVQSIRDMRSNFENGDLRAKLGRYHGDNVDCAFHGWAGSWCDPAFADWDISDCIAYLRVPVLFLQGRDDVYGSSAQAEVLVSESYAPVDVHFLDDCNHAPHLEQPNQTLAIVTDYLARLSRIEAAKPTAA